jgi:hypothetical protein
MANETDEQSFDRTVGKAASDKRATLTPAGMLKQAPNQLHRGDECFCRRLPQSARSSRRRGMLQVS